MQSFFSENGIAKCEYSKTTIFPSLIVFGVLSNNEYPWPIVALRSQAELSFL